MKKIIAMYFTERKRKAIIVSVYCF